MDFEDDSYSSCFMNKENSDVLNLLMELIFKIVGNLWVS